MAQAVEVPRTFYQNLPAPRAYQSLVDFAPGVSGSRTANPSILGGTANSNIYLVDGISTTDPVTGTFGLNFTFDVIEAVDVKLTGISAEYGEHQGGIVNLINGGRRTLDKISIGQVWKPAPTPVPAK